ncbi:ninjurin-1 [Diachasma alloeum]|uniref:ninjurin-1 n=1 Tax=Diachasma alloeum TaxID=454923 RepID=UPI0007382962|nr:ninjurin-1 [Diachasma alloeum]
MAKDAGLPQEIIEKPIVHAIVNDLSSVTETALGDEVELGVVEVKPEETALEVDTTDQARRAARQESTYAAKKTVAQGMMDVALITANANQLRYLVEYQRESPTFWFIVSLITISLSLQVAVGVSLIFKGRFDIKGKSRSPQALRINNYVVVAVFLITIINVFVAAFSITSPPAVAGASTVNNAAA